MMGSKPLAPLALAALATIVVAGCGGGGTSSTASLVTPGTPGSAKQSAAGGPAVAYVAGTPIPKSTYDHWLAVERAMHTTGDASHRVLGFLITTSWVLGEAAARHVSVSEAEVRNRLQEVEKKSFHKSSELQDFLAKSQETSDDLLARVRVELLQKRIAAQVTARKATLAAFQSNFASHWKRLTNCLPAYVMEDCKQYKGAPEHLTSTSSPRSSSASSSASTSGEVYTAPGAFSVSSPAFERNGTIPKQYTCDGSGVSPALSWQNIPKGAAELFLFVIDDTNSTAKGGIRWVVGGIDPSTREVAAGKLPAGGIVGTNTAGHASYGAICPDRGHTDTVEVVMYALRKKIPLSPGFQPSIAEHEYGAGKDLMGSAAVTYGVYRRA